MREFAWRMFAGELNASDLEHSGAGERAASYLITPLGARVNRLLLVGVLTELQNSGTEKEPRWRARVSDPTGTFFMTAGQYQLEAARVLSGLKPPCFVAVIGKCKLYSPEENVAYVSIRPEMVKEADAYARDYWIMEACRSLRDRLESFREVLKLEEFSREKIAALGLRDDLADGMALAMGHYKGIALDKYEGMLEDALRYLMEEGAPAGKGGTAEVAGPAKAGEAAGASKAGEDADNEKVVLQLVEALDRDGRGAGWDDLVSAAKKKKIRDEELEELTNSMLDKGLIFEPVLGKIKKA